MSNQYGRPKKAVSDWYLVGRPADPQGLTQMMIKYLEALRIKNYSENTLDSKTSYLSVFIDWADKRALYRPGDITKPILERYQRHLFYYRKHDGKPLSTQAQHGAAVAIRAWFKWLAKQNYILYNPASDIELPKLEKRLPKTVLSQREAESVMMQPNIHDPIGIRDRAILEVFYSTGIRRMEMINLSVHDVDADRGVLIVRQGKGKKDRVIPIGKRATDWTEKYIYDVRPDYITGADEGVLFLNRYGLPIHKGNLTTLVRRYIKDAKVYKGGACHVFRHTMATLMLDNGADIRYIQAMLGHVKLETTQIYTQVSIKRLKEVHNLTHPAQAQHLAKQKHDDEPAPTREALLAELALEAAEEND